jgi:CRISPR locus-related DNA-binding protein
MVIVFGTLGYEPKSLLPSLRREGVEKLVFFASTGEIKVDKAAFRVEDHCGKADIDVVRVPVEKPYDLEYVTRLINSRLRKFPDKEIIFNITGGTKVMASAALIVCFLKGIPTEYAKEGTDELIRLPLMKIGPKNQITRTQLKIVRYILSRKNKRCLSRDIMKALKKQKSTISTHLQSLKKKGLINVERDPQNSSRNMVSALPSLDILMLAEED